MGFHVTMFPVISHKAFELCYALIFDPRYLVAPAKHFPIQQPCPPRTLSPRAQTLPQLQMRQAHQWYKTWMSTWQQMVMMIQIHRVLPRQRLRYPRQRRRSWWQIHRVHHRQPLRSWLQNHRVQQRQRLTDQRKKKSWSCRWEPPKGAQEKKITTSTTNANDAHNTITQDPESLTTDSTGSALTIIRR